MDELIDRYGEPPRPVVALINVALMRVRASAIGLKEIAQKGNSLVLTFRTIDLAAVSGIIADPQLKKRVVFSAGDVPRLTMRLVSGEDPLKACEVFIRKYQSFAAGPGEA